MATTTRRSSSTRRYVPVLKAACGRDAAKLKAYADNWGFESTETDWRKLIERKDIDAIDIVTPNDSHAEIAIAAARAGKMVLCEKPLSLDGPQGEEMVREIEKAGVPNTVWYNYRRVPAVTLAKQIIDSGKLGKIFHYRANFLQDWTISADLPQGGAGLWRLDAKAAGSGVTGDLLAHCIDTALWLNGSHHRRQRDDRDLHQAAPAHPHRQGRGSEDRRRLHLPSATSPTARSRSSSPPATPAATRRSTPSRSTARTPRSSGICTICIACNSSTTATKASSAAGAASTSPMATSLT